MDPDDAVLICTAQLALTHHACIMPEAFDHMSARLKCRTLAIQPVVTYFCIGRIKIRTIIAMCCILVLHSKPELLETMILHPADHSVLCRVMR